jgi:hypothetical protein
MNRKIKVMLFFRFFILLVSILW